jgi:hypothetical protein
VFQELRNTAKGWDHNAAVNGYPLPLTEAAAKESGLPLHQVEREGFERLRRQHGVTGELQQSVITDLRGHPQWNKLVKGDLDALGHLRGDPTALRAEVERILDDLKGTLEMSGWEVLF